MDDRTNGWSGPTTEPAFAKATQVKIQRYQTFFYDNGFFLSGGPGPPSNPPPPSGEHSWTRACSRHIYSYVFAPFLLGRVILKSPPFNSTKFCILFIIHVVIKSEIFIKYKIANYEQIKFQQKEGFFFIFQKKNHPYIFASLYVFNVLYLMFYMCNVKSKSSQ